MCCARLKCAQLNLNCTDYNKVPRITRSTKTRNGPLADCPTREIWMERLKDESHLTVPGKWWKGIPPEQKRESFHCKIVEIEYVEKKHSSYYKFVIVCTDDDKNYEMLWGNIKEYWSSPTPLSMYKGIVTRACLLCASQLFTLASTVNEKVQLNLCSDVKRKPNDSGHGSHKKRQKRKSKKPQNNTTKGSNRNKTSKSTARPTVNSNSTPRIATHNSGMCSGIHIEVLIM